nr:aldehyde dehydrogenase family protein [Lentisphaera araneosa]
MIYSAPTQDSSIVSLKSQYENFIGGEHLPPVEGKYFDNVSPVNGEVFCQVARSSDKDVEKALDAAHNAFPSWEQSSVTERANILLKIADRIEDNLEKLALVETWDNGKPIRETLAADVPLAADHFRYFAGCIRAQEGGISEIDHDTVAYHFHEPIGVVAQIIPWNFPLLMAAWKLAPALAAGNCVVLKPAEQTPLSISVLIELIEDLIPPGVLNLVHGFGTEAGKSLASNSRIAKVAFTGSTPVGKQIMSYASENIIPITLELGGKSPNIFFEDIMDHGDDFIDKAIEGMLLGFFNQGEVCTCPSRILIQESIYDEFIQRVILRARKIVQGNPLDTETMLGAQASQQQLDKILFYANVAEEEGAQCLIGGERNMDDELAKGFYIKPTLYKGDNSMRIFKDEIFGPVLSVTTFKSEEEALGIANDTEYGLGAGIWTMDMNRAYRFGRQFKRDEYGPIVIICTQHMRLSVVIKSQVLVEKLIE